MNSVRFCVAGGGRRSYLDSTMTTEAKAESDGELMARVHQHDAEALAELWDRYGRLVYSGILRVVRDASLAEDLAQETFLRIWNRTQGFDAHRGSIGSWLLTVARNRSIDYLRSTSGRERLALNVDDTNHASLCTDMEEDILSSEKSRQIRQAMASLSPNQRQAIELAYFEGLSQTEVALRMGKPLGTVKSWVRTALKALRVELEPLTYGEMDWRSAA